MASLESLPPDQRAVLQLVLQRGRSYDEIARMLSIDRAAVRGRALAAFDALGPDTGLTDLRRALITDYLLRQLPPTVSDQTRDRLGTSPSERAWARVLASELAPLSNRPLPEIPVEGGGSAPPGEEWTSGADAPSGPSAPFGPSEPSGPSEQLARREPLVPDVADVPPEHATEKPKRQSIFAARRERAARPPKAPKQPRAAKPPKAPRPPKPPKEKVTVPTADAPRSSRFGGTLIIAATIVVVAVVAILLLSGGSSKNNSSSSSSAAANASSSTSTAASSTGAASSSATKVLAQINLTPPSSGSKAAGIAEVLQEGSADGIAIVAQHVPPNTTKPPNAYAVWLYNSAGDAHILGFVNPGVGSNGRLSTAGGLPANASHFKQLIVTVETKANPKVPGTIILQGALTGVG